MADPPGPVWTITPTEPAQSLPLPQASWDLRRRTPHLSRELFKVSCFSKGPCSAGRRRDGGSCSWFVEREKGAAAAQIAQLHPCSSCSVSGMGASEGARNAGANVWFRHGTEQRQWRLDVVLAADSEDDKVMRVPPEAPRRVPGSASRPYEAEAGLHKDDGTPLLSAADLIGALAGRRRASAQPQ